MTGRESVLDRVRAVAAQKAEAHHLDLDVPGYGGDLVVRLGPVGWDESVEVTERAQKQAGKAAGRAAWNAGADLLITGVRDVLLRTDDGLEPVNGDAPSRITKDLMVLLGFTDPPDTARGMLAALFCHAVSPELAVAAACAEYQAWLSGVDADVAEQTLGE